MDTNENLQPQDPQEGSGLYHAEGVGQQEFTKPDYSFHSYSGEGVYRQPVDQPESAGKPEKKKRGRAGRVILGILLAVALVLGSCGLTAAVLGNKWEQMLKLERDHFQQKVDVLQQQLDNKGNSGGEVIVSPTEGLTPPEVYSKTVKSVVSIACQSVTASFGQSYITESAGSGFILSADGYVVTNHHVIEGATSITVVCWDETEYEATLIGSDASNDIALLKVEAQDLQPVTIGSSDSLAVGSQVVAIGNALGELSASLTVGYISGKDRDITTDGTIINMLQTDAVINPGNSGGPLFNMRGEVIGINTAKYSGSTDSGASIEGIGFAIPIDDVIGMLRDLKDYGYITGVQMGVMVRNMDPTVANEYGFPMGAYVDSVVNGSCAQAAGIRAKDVIIDVGGYEIENLNDLTRALRNFKGGDEAIVTVWRGGREIRLTIVFDAKNPE